MTISPLTIEIAVLYDFRAPRPGESESEYREAVIRHVEIRDWSAANEVRLQKRQADWTPAEVDAFVARVKRKPHPSMEFEPGVHAFPVETFRGVPATWTALCEYADRAVAVMRERRRAHASIPVLLGVVTTDGRLLMSGSHPGHRLAILKTIIRREPAYGFFAATDAFIHAVKEHERAEKSEAFILHLGTRDGEREMWTYPYRVEDRRIVDEPRRVLDLRAMRADPNAGLEDPYAELFISIPPAESVS